MSSPYREAALVVPKPHPSWFTRALCWTLNHKWVIMTHSAGPELVYGECQRCHSRYEYGSGSDWDLDIRILEARHVSSTRRNKTV